MKAVAWVLVICVAALVLGYAVKHSNQRSREEFLQKQAQRDAEAKQERHDEELYQADVKIYGVRKALELKEERRKAREKLRDMRKRGICTGCEGAGWVTALDGKAVCAECRGTGKVTPIPNP